MPKQVMLHPRVVTMCAVLPVNALWLPEYWKKSGGADASWKMLSKCGSTLLRLPENKECWSPPRRFTWEAASLPGLTRSCPQFGTSRGNPSGGINIVDSSRLFLGHMLGAGP